MFDRVKTALQERLIGGCIAIAMCLQLAAQDTVTALSLFESATGLPVHVILTTDLKQIQKTKYKEEYQPATLQIIRGEGDTATYLSEIRCRGNMRKEVCYFPPMRMKMPKKDFRFNKIKWVNICDDTDQSEIFLLKEYLAYQMVEILTDKSFLTHLLRVQYQDAGSKQKTFTRYAFVIENEDQMAARFNGRVYEPKILKDHLLQREHLALFTFFQYMIGNTDWAFANRHNVEVITDRVTNALVPIPYDFDYSGFVNTMYAAPHETIPITHVTVRYNKGYCMDQELAESTRLLFLSKKEDIINTCKHFEYLDTKSRNTAVKYLEEFFKIMEDSKLTTRIFVKDCKPMQ